MKEPIYIDTQLTVDDFRNFSLYALFSQPIGWFIIFIGTIQWLAIIAYIINPTFTGSFPTFSLIFALLFTGIILWTYFGAKKAFDANSQLNEPINYTLTDKLLSIKGESFETRYTWDKIHNVRESKTLFLFYINKMHAHIVPKHNLTEIQMQQIKDLVIQIPNLKFKFRTL